MFGWPWFDLYPDPIKRPARRERPAWSYPMKTERTGSIDDMIEIKAVAGAVEIGIGDRETNSIMLRVPAVGIADLVKRLEAARDAAALMAGAKNTRGRSGNGVD
jgi:hypothetical protein